MLRLALHIAAAQQAIAVRSCLTCRENFDPLPGEEIPGIGGKVIPFSQVEYPFALPVADIILHRLSGVEHYLAAGGVEDLPLGRMLSTSV